MLYKRNTISRFCLATRKPYSSTLTFCSICESKQEIINLNSLLLSLPKSAYTTQLAYIQPVAFTKQDNVNAKIRNTSLYLYTSTNVLSTQNLSCIIQQLYSFSVILVLKEFCYLSLKD
jgi:hypothetical protein